MTGAYILPTEDGDALLAGLPLRAGDEIELWTAIGWLPGWYSYNLQTRRAFFMSRAFDPSGQEVAAVPINRPIMQFRRPE